MTRSLQVVAYYFPKLVDLHNYTAANSVGQKTYNWKTLNEKVQKATRSTDAEVGQAARV